MPLKLDVFESRLLTFPVLIRISRKKIVAMGYVTFFHLQQNGPVIFHRADCRQYVVVANALQSSHPYHWLVGQSVANSGLSGVEFIYQALAKEFHFLPGPFQLMCQIERIVHKGVRFGTSSARK